MKSEILKYVIILFALYSCIDARRTDFTEESFPKSYHLTNPNRIKIDSLIIEWPTGIRYHKDSFLIVQDNSTDCLIKIIDLKTKTIQNIIHQGRGPGEMLVAWGISLINNDIFLFCGQLRKIIVLKLNDNRTFSIKDEFFLEERQTLGVYPMKEDFLVCLSNIGDKNRLTFLNEKGKIINKTGSYPPFKTKENIIGDNDIFNSFITASPNGNRFALACGYTDLIEIFDEGGTLIKRIKGPVGIDLTVSTLNTGIGTVIKREPSYLTFNKIISNNTEIWTGYVGYKVEKNKRSTPDEAYPKKIFCFDWNGNAIRKIALDDSFRAFDINWTDSVLYAVIWKLADPEIEYFSLKKILHE